MVEAAIVLLDPAAELRHGGHEHPIRRPGGVDASEESVEGGVELAVVVLLLPLVADVGVEVAVSHVDDARSDVGTDQCGGGCQATPESASLAKHRVFAVLFVIARAEPGRECEQPFVRVDDLSRIPVTTGESLHALLERCGRRPVRRFEEPQVVGALQGEGCRREVAEVVRVTREREADQRTAIVECVGQPTQETSSWMERAARVAALPPLGHGEV